jgi:transcriptional regulator with XRE-family HTH domain
MGFISFNHFSPFLTIKINLFTLFVILDDIFYTSFRDELNGKVSLFRHIVRIMKISTELTDEAVLEELGGRLAAARMERHLTQSALAVQAGISKRTIERLESGEVATQLSGFLRVCRALGLLERLEIFLPESVPGPMEQLRQMGRKRQRFRARKSTQDKPGKWTWGEPT